MNSKKLEDKFFIIEVACKMHSKYFLMFCQGFSCAENFLNEYSRFSQKIRSKSHFILLIFPLTDTAESGHFHHLDYLSGMRTLFLDLV